MRISLKRIYNRSSCITCRYTMSMNNNVQRTIFRPLQSHFLLEFTQIVCLSATWLEAFHPSINNQLKNNRFKVISTLFIFIIIHIYSTPTKVTTERAGINNWLPTIPLYCKSLRTEVSYNLYFCTQYPAGRD